MSFRYRRITWTYLKGNLIVSDEWNRVYEEDNEAGEVVDLYEGADEETLAKQESDATGAGAASSSDQAVFGL